MKLKAICPLLALACLLIFPGALLAQRRPRVPAPPTVSESNENTSKIFVSTEGRFSIRLPGSPKKSGQVINTGVGSLPSYAFTLKTAMAEYLISYMDFPSAFDDPAALKAAYDGGRDQTLSSSHLALVSERDFSVQGNIGRQITAVGKDGLFNFRIVAVGKRLYQVIIVTQDYRKRPRATIKRFDEAINNFLDTFNLIGDGAQSNTSVAENQNTAGSVDLGRMENSVYINDFFNFRLSLPDSWPPVESEATKAALEVSKQMVKGSDKTANEGVDQSITRTFVLFTVTKFPLRTQNVIQAMLQCAVEVVNDPKMTARVYLEKNRDFLINSPVEYKLLRDVYPATVAGVSYFVMDMQQSAGGMTIKQKYYATMRKGYALFFVTNYFDDADGLLMDRVLQSANFQ